ncbi:hypothetical protein SAMN02745704_01034 [Paucidesulfovibrio gracilis DSM 16080]|uniref:DUF456 domain-containing protein n=1 Tax=Paucidesulfovibrio gracilis DSM 16080 TaxID=1121449 RepID=A0A1T4WKR7_9BACT|nr:DUF456 domain-containing protein [Paucidesulfovibrio gracilis]SKA77747.1 hypothetical protein SAMN02745704_01034 [Paucidesulfovibrio gracilis DSM 16080]
MDHIWAFLFLLLLFAAQSLNIFSLPGNWLVVIFASAWVLVRPEHGLTWLFVGVLAALAFAGEAVEWLAQSWGAKKYGASGRGNFGGFIGAIVGAILGAPFLFGVGALLGALLGAYAGCFVFEISHGRPASEASRASMGAFFGKSLGMTIKLSLGLTMFALCAPRVWP